MKRVLITGNAGSGKTTFAKILKSEVNLPSHGLDSIVWQPGWKATPFQERQEKFKQIASNQEWIVDGVSKQIFEAADTIFFLDIPLSKCLGNIIKRFTSNGFKTRESLPVNCPEYIGVFKAIHVAFLYQKHTRPVILQMIKSSKGKKIYWIRDYRQLQSWKLMAT
jgi:adenylate kinase family enzyme